MELNISEITRMLNTLQEMMNEVTEIYNKIQITTDPDELSKLYARLQLLLEKLQHLSLTVSSHNRTGNS